MKHLLWHIGAGWQLSLEFKIEDLWVGAFWKWSAVELDFEPSRELDIWICILPCLPVHLHLHGLKP